MAGADCLSYQKPVVLVMRRRKTPTLAVAALAGACGTEPPVPASVEISPLATTLLWVGDTARLTATVRDLYGRTIPGVAVAWTSGDESVVTVDAAGLVTAAGEGVAPVLAIAEGLAVSASSTVGVDPQRGALVRIYEALGGPGWHRIRNWGTDEPFDRWWGVRTDASGQHVVGLDLSFNDLAGAIPSELGGLDSLRYLSLHSNEITGPIPPELGRLDGLDTLDLSSNDLTGPIPSELGNLRRLRRLYLDDNALTGPIPPELGSLDSLEHLYLHGNELTGPVPPELGNLRSLGTLNLSSNELTGPIPPELGSLRGLGYLYLHGNELTGPVPPELGNLRGLGYLNLSSNELTGPIPPELGNLRNLWTLNLSSNELTGPIPPELGNLWWVDYLAIDHNPLSGRLPRELIGITLSRFYWYETDLCSPPDGEFREWLLSISSRRGNGPCDS